MSGVKLTEGCMITYQDIQKSKKHRYAVFVIREGQIDVETVSWPPLDKFRTPASRTDKGNIMLYLRLVHATAPSQNSWWTSTRRRERARTADTASMTTSTLSVPTEPSQPSNPNCSSWVGARMELRSRRKCSTPRGNLHLFVSLCNNWSYITITASTPWREHLWEFTRSFRQMTRASANRLLLMDIILSIVTLIKYVTILSGFSWRDSQINWQNLKCWLPKLWFRVLMKYYAL